MKLSKAIAKSYREIDEKNVFTNFFVKNVHESGMFMIQAGKLRDLRKTTIKSVNYTIFFYLFSNFEKSTNDHERIAFNKFICRSESTIICWIFDNKTILIETWKKYRKNYFKKMLKF